MTAVVVRCCIEVERIHQILIFLAVGIDWLIANHILWTLIPMRSTTYHHYILVVAADYLQHLLAIRLDMVFPSDTRVVERRPFGTTKLVVVIVHAIRLVAYLIDDVALLLIAACAVGEKNRQPSHGRYHDACDIQPTEGYLG